MDPSSSTNRDGVGEGFNDELRMDLIRAAIDGNAEIFNEPNLSDGDFKKKTREENNILHIAVRYEQKNFVKEFVNRDAIFNKKLISERNSHGNTPLHVAAEVGSKSIAILLCDYIRMNGVEGEKEKPWRAQNSDGNTALHLALLSNNANAAIFFMERDGDLARIVNNSLETPFHLAITQLPSYWTIMATHLVENAKCVANWHDAKGLTPLLRVASLDSPSFIFEITKKIINVCPASTLACDLSGKSFLHLFIHNKIFYGHQKNFDKYIEDLICLKEISILKNYQDQDGNTPLHIAAKCENIHMMRSLLSKKCSANPYITNKDGISAKSMIEQLHLWHQVQEPRIMTVEEASSAKGDIKLLEEIAENTEWLFEFYGSQDDNGSNFLHLLMNKTDTLDYFSSYEGCCDIWYFIKKALSFVPELVYQTDQKGNTPLHILAHNKDFCDALAEKTYLGSRNPLRKHLLSMILSECDNAITKFKSKRTTTNESDNHDQLPWVMQNEDGNTPLHQAIIANNEVLVLELLGYCEESARLVNREKETPLHLLAKATISMKVEEILKMVNANSKAIGMQDKDGLIPVLRANNAKNLNVMVTLLCNYQEFSNTNGQTLWQIFLQNQSYNFLDVLLKEEAFREMLKQKNKDGNTPLHIAIQERHFDFFQKFLEEWGSERDESLEDKRWLMRLLRVPNNEGKTLEDLLADLPTISEGLEEKLLADRRMRGIRSSWRIPRTQLQNYMNSMNVIAALQTTITFTAAFTVPGGLIQDTGTPILIQSIAFQVFMISDVIAMCLSMMVLICLLWMVATKNRVSIMIQDFAVRLLLASFVATLITFMTGVYATIYPVKQWIAIATLVLCSFLILLVQKFMVTMLLLPLKNATSNFVYMIWGSVAEFCPKFLLPFKNAAGKLLGAAAKFCSNTCKKLKGDDSDIV